MRKLMCVIVACVMLLTSCSDTKTPGGVKYKVLKKGDGSEITKDKMLVLDILLKDSKDSVWFNTETNDQPTMVRFPPTFKEEEDQGEFGVYKNLSKGDCVTFKIPAEIVFVKTRRMPVPPKVDPSSLFSFVVSVNEVFTPKEGNEFRKASMQKAMKKQRATDSLILVNYLKEKNIEATRTESGLYYVVKKAGKGPLATPGKTATVHYAGFNINGKLFDTSIAAVAKANGFDNQGRNEPYPVPVKQHAVIAGWDEMLQLMNKGMQVTAYIPSHLAYGPRGKGDVPPNTILIFDLEVLDIK